MDRVKTYKAATFVADTFSYDLESRLTRRTRLAAGQPTDVIVYDLRGKVLNNTGVGDAATYLPIGPVKTLGVTSEGRTEQYTTDGLGHRRWSSVLAGNQDAATVQWGVFEPITARLLKTYPRAGDPRSDTTFYFYQIDGAHRETNAKHFIWKQQGGGCSSPSCLDYTETRNTLNDYDLEGHLATSTFTLDTLAGQKSLPPGYQPYKVYTTYRYDALGRRVWARTMRGTNCAAKLNPNAVCVSTVTRTVWDGAQVLFEVRASGDSLAGTAMESDASTDPKYGRVGYVHGLGIDAPLALFKGTQMVFPHATWRGVYDRGSCLPEPCPSGLQFPGGNGSASVWGPTGVDPDKADWYGSLIWDQQDATGYQYKRNRYYDPGTGRFTQEDPIGLAGALNLYGFAGGDPVNFADPFGLWPEWGELASSAREWLQNTESGQLTTALVCIYGCRGTTVEAQNALDAAETKFPILIGTTRGSRPELPGKVLARGGEVKVFHNYRGEEHGPAHAHVAGGGRSTRIGPKGYPLRGDPPLTSAQQRVVDEYARIIRRELNRIGRWLESQGR